MLFQDILKWMVQEFGYPVPEEYVSFLEKGDFTTTANMYYVIDRETEMALEISEWYRYDDLILVYKNCCDERMIEKHHLPIFDSCGCTVVIDCNPQGESYGQVFMRTPTGYFDEELQRNIYLEFDYVAKSLAEILPNLITLDELEEMGL